MRSLRYFAALLAMLAVPILAEEFTGKVVGVTNGDTIAVIRNAKQVAVRLDGIDCPEIKQAFGDKAKEATKELVLGKTVTIQAGGKDRDGRFLAEVILPDGKNLNQELVRSGFAWWYKQYSRDESLGKLEADARAAQLGLWTDKDPMMPWEWRQRDVQTPGRKEPPPVPVESNRVEIVALLPDPVHQDSGHEEATLDNSTAQEISLSGWILRSDGHEYKLTDTISPKSKRVIKLSKAVLPNTGAVVMLIDRDGVVRSLVSYSARNVKVGETIDFRRTE